MFGLGTGAKKTEGDARWLDWKFGLNNPGKIHERPVHGGVCIWGD